MTDIVDRLRVLYATHPVVMEAIAEIKQLREVRENEGNEIERLQKDKTQIAEVAARLEAELYAVLSERNVQAAEIECLRAALRSLYAEIMCFVVEPPSAALNHAIEEASRALEPKT